MGPELQFAYLMSGLLASFPLSLWGVYALHGWLCENF